MNIKQIKIKRFYIEEYIKNKEFYTS